MGLHISWVPELLSSTGILEMCSSMNLREVCNALVQRFPAVICLL